MDGQDLAPMTVILSNRLETTLVLETVATNLHKPLTQVVCDV